MELELILQTTQKLKNNLPWKQIQDINVDSTRIWNMINNWPENKPIGFRYSYLINYLGDRRILESLKE